MSLRKTCTFLLVIIVFLSFGWYGCSDDTITTNITSDQLTNSSSNASYYFPLSEGYTTIYNITYANGVTERNTFVIGKKQKIQGVDVVEWIENPNIKPDTSYFRATSNELFYYENINAQAEKVLDLPLTAGHQWSRFNNTGSTTFGFNDFTDIITGNYQNNDTVTATNNIYNTYKTLPLTGSGTMVVDNTEDVLLGTGVYYHNAIKMHNDGTNNKKNYYWFVANIGLVKYVIGATPNNNSSGDIIGELIDYGY